MVAAQ